MNKIQEVRFVKSLRVSKFLFAFLQKKKKTNFKRWLILKTGSWTVASLAWVPWVPRNPSKAEEWVPEPINFEP